MKECLFWALILAYAVYGLWDALADTKEGTKRHKRHADMALLSKADL
jgi:hypothetical protein